MYIDMRIKHAYNKGGGGKYKLTSKEILKELRKDGWMEIGQRGSHLSLKHPIKPGKVTLPMHSGDLPRGTLNSILKQAGLK